MTRMTWDDDAKRLFRAGLYNTALYPQDSKGKYEHGVSWDAMNKVSESPEGAEATPIYTQNSTYLNIVSAEEFKGTIEAYMYPEEFNKCQGRLEHDSAKGLVVTGQNRSPFGLVYYRNIGSKNDGLDHGYEIHIVYNASAGVSSEESESVGKELTPATLSWPFTTIPVTVPGMKKRTAHLIIDSRTTEASKLKALEDVLFGTESTEPTLPEPAELISILTKGVRVGSETTSSGVGA